MSDPLVSCLTATHGRFRWVQQAISAFVQQDYPARELIVLNNHPVPLVFDHPLVRIVNEPGHPTLGDCRNRLLDFAHGEFVRTWDDDDLYLPWSISQGVEHIGSAAAFKPDRSWFSRNPTNYELFDNVFEAAILVRARVARMYGYKASGGDEHSPLLQGIEREGGTNRASVGVLSGYVYTFGWGRCHISGSLGSSTVEARTANWMRENNEPGDGVTPIQVVDLSHYWRAMVAEATLRYGASEGARLAAEFARHGVQTVACEGVGVVS